MARYFAFTFLIFALGTPALGAGSRKGKSNCKVELIKEASAGSILIELQADDKDDCERAKGNDVQISYSGENAPKKPAPQKKK